MSDLSRRARALDVLDDGAEHGEEEEDGVEDADELDAGGAAEEAAALARRVRQAAHSPAPGRQALADKQELPPSLPPNGPPVPWRCGALKRPKGNTAPTHWAGEMTMPDGVVRPLLRTDP